MWTAKTHEKQNILFTLKNVRETDRENTTPTAVSVHDRRRYKLYEERDETRRTQGDNNKYWMASLYRRKIEFRRGVKPDLAKKQTSGKLSDNRRIVIKDRWLIEYKVVVYDEWWW